MKRRAAALWRELIGMVRWKHERDVEALAWERARMADREWHTGVWRSRTGARFRVRYDPVINRFFVWGKTAGGQWGYRARPEAVRIVRVLERAGWEPDRGPRTSEVRSRLGL